MKKELEKWIDKNNPYNGSNSELIWTAICIAWQEKVTKQGYRYEIARTLDDFETIVDNYLDER